MANYTTPGVYIQEVPNLPPAVAQVETAIPVFIGVTQKADATGTNDLNKIPTRIESLVEYQQYFGGAELELHYVIDVTTNSGTPSSIATLPESTRSKHMMFYALQLFYANGGGPCYIVSVGRYTDTVAATDVTDGLTAAGRADEPTLIVLPDAQGYSLANYLAIQVAALQQCADLQDRFVIMDLHGADGDDLNALASPSTITSAVTAFRALTSSNLMYGAAYAPNIETTLSVAVDTTTAAQVFVNAGTGVTLDSLKTSNTQAYNLALAALNNMTLKLPPSGAIAGVYAAVDNARGVWKAPANVGIATAIGPTISITAAEQGTMNVDPTGGKSVNAIRAFAGLGTLVWGARTLAGNDNEWRYVNVRRFCIMVEESIKKATMQFVFEPNDANTWVKVQGMIENFLTTQWRQGALQGVKPEDAFYVSVGLGKTMSADDVLNGRMIVQVGLCPVRPAEFIVLQFIQTLPVS